MRLARSRTLALKTPSPKVFSTRRTLSDCSSRRKDIQQITVIITIYIDPCHCCFCMPRAHDRSKEVVVLWLPH